MKEQLEVCLEEMEELKGEKLVDPLVVVTDLSLRPLEQ
jgi:hypothetical protein